MYSCLLTPIAWYLPLGRLPILLGSSSHLPCNTHLLQDFAFIAVVSGLTLALLSQTAMSAVFCRSWLMYRLSSLGEYLDLRINVRGGNND